MKKLILALLCVLLTAGLAFAVDVDLKGMYYARGSYLDNDKGVGNENVSGVGQDDANYFFFDHELDATARLLVSDKTRVIVNFEIRDESWLRGNTDGTSQNGTSNLDDNIEFKRVFSSHTFDYGGVLDLGLMTGGAWMTGFGDNGNGRYRVKYTQPTQLGPVIAIYEKNYESGARNNATKKAEKDDSTAYYLASVMKFGDFNVYPLIGYGTNSFTVPTQSSKGDDTFLFLLGSDATFGDFGFEAEFNYLTTKTDVNADTATTYANETEDFSRWGLYGNGWWNIGAAKVGLLAAYGSWDKDRGDGFGMGEDFTPTIFGADETNIGGSGTTTAAYSNGLSEWKAVTMVQLYGSLAISEQFSISGHALYWDSNAKDNGTGTGKSFWYKADGYEIDAGLAYKITDAVTYSAVAAFGKISLDDSGTGVVDDSPDGYVRAYHKFQINF